MEKQEKKIEGVLKEGKPEDTGNIEAGKNSEVKIIEGVRRKIFLPIGKIILKVGRRGRRGQHTNQYCQAPTIIRTCNTVVHRIHHY